MKDSYPYYLANRPIAANQDLEVIDKYTGEVATRVALADAETIDKAITAAVKSKRPMRLLAPYQRQIAATMKLVAGDPKDEATFIGPMISEGEAKRLEDWVNKAKAAGGKVLCGGKRQGAMLQATLMENVPDDQPLCAEEAFGPVAILSKFSNFNEALAEANNSDYGLQVGIFTRDIYKMMRAWDETEVGGVLIGDVPSWRVDNMPYGGVKNSGLGREGVRFAMEDMTEIRLLVIRTPDDVKLD